MRNSNTGRTPLRAVQEQIAASGAVGQAAQGGPALMEKFWAPAVLAVLLAWGSAAYFVYTSFGWFGRSLTATSLIMAAAVVVLFIRGAMGPDGVGEAEAAELGQGRRAA